jgi:glutamate N-acetyltransferase / amino-acid N-acetyltransferase
LTLPLGYRYAACYAGIRKVEKDDVVLIVPDAPATAAAVFTTNLVQAAPVRLARAHLKASRGKVGAVLVNAGNANCATRTGDKVALATSRAVAGALAIPVEQVIPASTGVIGVEMNPQPIVDAVPHLTAMLSPALFHVAANAILTTDLVPKTSAAEVKFGRQRVRVAGFTKGSGMIQPRMATTLGFVMMDCAVGLRDLKAMLSRAVGRSYNRLSVDGDTSTNDMMLVLANGASGVAPDAQGLKTVESALGDVMESLAEQIARDGEGASKLVRITVEGGASEADAERIARGIANSPLVKTAIAGSDANWGRILSAAGNSGARFDPAKVDIFLQGVKVCRAGLAAEFDEAALKLKLDEKECQIRFVIRGEGAGSAKFWTCDFTEGYIRINASYRT